MLVYLSVAFFSMAAGMILSFIIFMFFTKGKNGGSRLEDVQSDNRSEAYRRDSLSGVPQQPSIHSMGREVLSILKFEKLREKDVPGSLRLHKRTQALAYRIEIFSLFASGVAAILFPVWFINISFEPIRFGVDFILIDTDANSVLTISIILIMSILTIFTFTIPMLVRDIWLRKRVSDGSLFIKREVREDGSY